MKIINSCILVIISIIAIIMPLFEINDVNWIFLSMMLVYFIVGILKYADAKDAKDIVLAISSLIIGGVLFGFDLAKDPLSLSFCLLAWIIVTSFIKLFKTDFYHDVKDQKWKTSLIGFLIFIAVGIISCVSLHYGIDTQVIVLGYFFLVTAILDLFDSTILVKE